MAHVSDNDPSATRRVPDQEEIITTEVKNGVTEHSEFEEKAEKLNITYDDDEFEPAIHATTWIALLALCLQSYCQLFALMGPPTLVRNTFIWAIFCCCLAPIAWLLQLDQIALQLDGVAQKTWVPNSLLVVQATFCTMLSYASDLFQARKAILVACTTVAFVGAAIAPGSQSIGRLIAAQTLIGAALAVIPLTFVVPSEILPKKWRPMAQAAINTGGALGMVSAPLIMGGLSKHNLASGWRHFYWIETGLWGCSALSLFIGYRPPKRHSRLDHLSFWQKLGRLDLIGSLLLAAALSIFMTGLSLGGNQYSWTSTPTLSTLIIGLVGLLVFGLYEWKGTKTGILHHDLFDPAKTVVRTFVICLILIFIEGVMVFAFIIFNPILQSVVYEPSNLFLATARLVPYFAGTVAGTGCFGYIGVRLRSLREVLAGGFFITMVGHIGMATIQPDHSANPLVFGFIAGFGSAAALSQCVAGVQLASPHAHIAIATAMAVTARAISSSCFTSIYVAVFSGKLTKYLPDDIATAAAAAGLPRSSIPGFVAALAAGQTEKLASISGVTPAVVAAGVRALKQAYTDSIRYVFIISVPFILLATILSWWLGDVKKVMTYHVDAPVEELHAKVEHHKTADLA